MNVDFSSPSNTRFVLVVGRHGRSPHSWKPSCDILFVTTDWQSFDEISSVPGLPEYDLLVTLD